jgi:hypothetical protein
MSAENDVPLGEESRRYYDQQFGDRIREVSKGGGNPGRGGGSNWNGRAGIGIAVGVIVVILRLVLAVSRTSSSTPSYTYTPPPPPQFNGENFDERFAKGDKDDQQKRLNEILRQMMDGKPVEVPQAALPQGVALEGDALRVDEVPLLQGLCYRIHQERLRAEPTPGGRICQFLDADARKLIARSAGGGALDADEKEELLEALNELLPRQDLYDAAAFGKFEPGMPGPVPISQYNRLLLEKCYPRQIVPLSERGQLDAGARGKWIDRARADLDAARKQYEPAKQ